ncbi:metal ABC transporter solute-binding protein, Zn/Mn family [Candidatus Aquiluna sp. UB-MaderosW2red]|jgi:zinc/manganese transport system substrate-binding protein|uniref:metal ABC transporter solute-binding protein, Zn/Mn family n=1 Tax=Candidatus Aquiluna sp. UB-MaderosW2red TaxID=1855377 RepID=UPI000875BD0D|nr:zinc ABC transporter substrate-binding protein [Candidatus Aquiluna sp. UB-MaderosW2red]SCX04291.1 zinc/manganese transport system substrate-binding protein [Candidatus Aquiluna sp. UB-MaderosW2red]
MKRWQVLTAVGIFVALIAGLTLGPVIFSRDSPSATTNPSPSPTLTRDGDTGVIKVVASTNVWANIIELVGGEWVEVTTIIDSVAKDPHSYEASARDQLAINDAELVVYNGGGYDDFMLTLISAAPETKTVLPLIDPADSNESDNEHIWYDLGRVEKAAEDLAAVITELRPEAFAQINTNYDFFVRELSNLEIRVEALRDRALGLGVIAPEGVANRMLQNAGFINMTPVALARAVEEEREVPLTALSESKELLEGKVAILLVTNSQVSDQISKELSQVAQASGASVVDFSELLPVDLDYLDWMAQVIDQLQEAIY